MGLFGYVDLRSGFKETLVLVVGGMYVGGIVKGIFIQILNVNLTNLIEILF